METLSISDFSDPSYPLDSSSLGAEAWAAFLSAYSQGDWSNVTECPDVCPTKEPLSISSNEFHDKDGEIDDHQIYTSPEITRDVARNVRNFFHSKDYLPPPRSPHEHLRKSCILEYNLYGDAQKANIRRAVDVLSAFFPGDVIVSFTLFDGRYQTLAAIGGNEALSLKYGLTSDKPIPSYSSLCGHSVLTEDLMFVPDLAQDWRFRSNPFIDAGILSCIGSPVSLHLDSRTIIPADKNPDVRIGIGAIIVLFVDHKLTTLSNAQRMVVKNVTLMLETQLRSTWEGQVKTREIQTRAMISDLIEDAFVIQQKYRQETEDTAQQLIDRQQRDSVYKEKESFTSLTEKVVERLMDLLPHLSGLAVVDIASSSSNASVTTAQPLKTIAQSPRGIWTIPSTTPRSIFTRNQRTSFDISTPLSGLEFCLGAEPRSHIIMPFFASDEPGLAIVGTSRDEAIRPADLAVIRSVGSVLTAKRIQIRVEEADSAKTAFLSAISHELRTPMHSITAGIDLARSAVASKDWLETQSALDDVQACGSTLQKILNDVLDYGKSASTHHIHTPARPVMLDLSKLFRDAAAACLPQFEGYGPGFSLDFEHEGRDWNAEVDEAKIYRIIINGLTNALKFCKTGPITMSLLSSGENVVMRVKDTGTGFDEATLPRLLEPFTKDDWHSPGAGLGLHITQNLVHSLGGKLCLTSQVGVGTLFEVTIPCRLRSNLNHVASRPSLPNVREIIRPSTPTPAQISTFTGSDSVKPAGWTSATFRILVVDDNALCRRILVKGLKKGKIPIETCEAADGQAALDCFPTFVPDLVLTDVSMPIMDGITSAELMRSVSTERKMKQCKIYAITGLGSTDPRLKTVALDGTAALDGWLVKGKDDLKVITRIVEEVYEGKINA